jgi:FHA domain
MTACNICGEKILEGSRTCSVCGSSADEFLPAGTGLSPFADAPPSVAPPIELAPDGSYCPACAKVFGPERTDAFCVCGTFLLRELPSESPPPAAIIDETPPLAPILEDSIPPLAPLLEDLPAEPTAAADANSPAVKVRAAKPASGTPCLVLYGPDKQPLQYFTLSKDAMTIGRLDAVAGIFPDIDLDEWFDRAIIRKISRQHAVILRTRATNTFALRPLAGNTGTQLDARMVQPQQDYPLKPGHRIILGGVIRLKFEIA